MTGLCCIGGVCVPTTAVYPIVLLVVRHVYLTLLKWYKKMTGHDNADAITGGKEKCLDKGCCGTSTSTSTAATATTTLTRRGKRGKSSSSTVDVVGTVQTEEEFRTVLAEHDVVVVQFTADWCGPCQQIKPWFTALGRQRTGGRFVLVDVDQLDTVAAECKVSMMPTFVVFRNGARVATMTGSEEDALTRFLTQHVPV